MNSKKKFYVSLIALVLSFVFAVSFTAAWLVNQVSISGNFLIVNSNIDISANIYSGLDDNFDGVLNQVNDNSGNSLATTRATKVQYQYSLASKTGLNTFEQIAEGNIITYKTVIINTSTNDAMISLNFSDLQNYFFNYIQYYIQNTSFPDESSSNYQGFVDLLGANSARVLYEFKIVGAREYSGTGSFDSGFDTLVASSVVGEVTGGVSQIKNINSLTSNGTENTFNLWQISNREKFVNRVILSAGNLLEVDFQLKELSLRDVVDAYTQYSSTNYLAKGKTLVGAYYDANTQLTRPSDSDIAILAQNYITDFANKELTYFTDSKRQLLDLNIENIYITAENKGASA